MEVLSVVRAGLTDEPFQDYPGDERPCVDLGDLDEGSRLQFIAVNATDQNRECHDCEFVRARVQLANVEVLEDLGIPVNIPEPWFASLAHVRIGTDCEGEYSIGVMPVRDEFIGGALEATPSDHVVVREFRVFTGGACGSNGGRCWDSWYARITNEDGVQISRDMPEPSR